VTNLPKGVAQKAAQYTAVWGGIRGNGEESPSFMGLAQLLKSTALSGEDRQETAHSVNHLNYQSGGQGIRHCFCNSLQDNRLEQSLECAGTKSGTLCESPVETPEIQELLDIATAWSSLPPNIRVAIVLLVQQHVR